MRVLWFTNTPSLGAKHLNSAGVGGSWIGSLEAALTKVPGIELGVAFPWSQSDSGPFTVGTTRYFPVLTKKIKGSVNKIVHRWSHQIEREDHIQNYLKVIEEFKPDVIHLFGTETDYGLIISKTTIP